MISLLPLSRAQLVGALAALVLCAPTSSSTFAQGTKPQLRELVPATAYSMWHMRHDPSMQFVNDGTDKVMKAIQEARFHELAIEALGMAGAGNEEAEQLGGLIDLVTALVGSVDWSALIDNEMIYAEGPTAPTHWSPPGLGSMLLASRLDADRVHELEGALANLLGAAGGLTEELDLQREERTGSDGSVTRVYSLRLTDMEHVPLLQMAVRDDLIMLGFGQEFFDTALSILEGKSTQSLVRTRRFKNAVGTLPENTPSMMYFDAHRLFGWLKESIPQIMMTMPGANVAIAPVQDILGLADFTDISVTVVHAEGLDLVSECWTTYRPEAVEQGNPFYLAMRGAQPTGELLDFVPANAIAFNLSQDIDLRPFYTWALERFEYYVPQASDNLLGLKAAQAIMDLSIEDDLLSWLGSETLSVTLPSGRFPGETETVVICRLRDADGARKVINRVHAVFDAVVPPLLERLEQELASQGQSSPIRKLKMTNASGSFPSMKQLEIGISAPGLPIPLPQIPTMTFGVIGNLLLVTTSEQALQTVFEVAAGEADGLWDHPAFVDGQRLPSQAVSSASLQPMGRQLQESANLFGTLSATMGFVLKSQPSQDIPLELISQAMQKVAGILRSIDFYDDVVCYSEMSEDGMTRYSRSSTRYVASDN